MSTIQIHKASQILRNAATKYIQTSMIYGYNTPSGKYRCALGVLLSEVGWDGNSDGLDDLAEFQLKLREEYGLRDSIREQIIHLNDHSYSSYDEIANWLESKNL